MTGFAKGMICLTFVGVGWVTAPVLESALPQKQNELFLAKALDVNTREIDLAEKGASNASRPEVKKFAQQLATDHKELQKDLLNLASETKIGVAAGLSNEHRQTMIKLLVLKGDDFDRTFLKHMVRGHEEAIKLFETEGLKQTHEPCRALSEKTLPILRKHLKDAQTLGAEASADR